MSESSKMNEPEITVSTAEASMKSSLIVVSNRLPFVLKRNTLTGKMERQARLAGKKRISFISGLLKPFLNYKK